MTGAGFGGCAVAIVGRRGRRFRAATSSAYWPAPATPAVYVCSADRRRRGGVVLKDLLLRRPPQFDPRAQALVLQRQAEIAAVKLLQHGRSRRAGLRRPGWP